MPKNPTTPLNSSLKLLIIRRCVGEVSGGLGDMVERCWERCLGHVGGMFTGTWKVLGKVFVRNRPTNNNMKRMCRISSKPVNPLPSTFNTC